MTAIPLSAIRTDGGTQPRAELNFVTIADYADDMREGAIFPPVVVFYDGADYWLADGFHRLSAAQQIGAVEIAADVRQGTIEDARWFSYGVNKDHGLRRTNEDKRRAVEAALAHPYHARYSNREIARHCGVDEGTVRRHRDVSAEIPQIDTSRLVNRNGTTYEMNVSAIGQRPADPLPFIPTAADYADPLGDDEPWTPSHTPQPAGVSPLFAGASVEWYTPRSYIEAAHTVMGGIDLDPASNQQAQERIGATVWYGLDHPDPDSRDGLAGEWYGRVWLNPPYGAQGARAVAATWAEQLIREYDAGRVSQAVLLVNAVIDSKWFDPLWRFPICLTNHRIRFDLPADAPTDANTSPIIGSAFVYFGPNVAAFVNEFSRFGAVVARLGTDGGEVVIDVEAADVR